MRTPFHINKRSAPGPAISPFGARISSPDPKAEEDSLDTSSRLFNFCAAARHPDSLFRKSKYSGSTCTSSACGVLVKLRTHHPIISPVVTGPAAPTRIPRGKSPVFRLLTTRFLLLADSNTRRHFRTSDRAHWRFPDPIRVNHSGRTYST